MNKPLKIYNASAGSGKTYQLVLQFLRLILSNQSDNSIKEIIAMTFTNKAANEMKERIISSLFGLANYSEIKDNTILGYFNQLKEDGYSEKEIFSRSKKQLKKLLHAYEDFHVMTIDKFNLKLIRQFSRDLDLPGKFEVILDEKEIIEQSIDLLIDNIGKKKHELSTKLVYNYAKNNIDEGKRWDIRNQMLDFLQILSKENYFSKISELKNKKTNPNSISEWNKKINSINSGYVEKSTKAFRLFQQLNIEDDSLPGKSTVGNQLRKMGKFQTLKEKINISTINACKKDTPNGRVFPEQLKQIILDADLYRENNTSKFELLNLLKSNYYKISLLRFVSNEINNIKNENQLIRISEFNKLVSILIQDSSTPYIYEKIGTKYKHFLLDEFQDTSRLQWLNMIPLIEESISTGNVNFIVGDPKQAIYRFRNGMAEQFVELPKIYNPENFSHLKKSSKLFETSGVNEELEVNRRSGIEIIKFNNFLFEHLSKELLNNSSFYHSSTQKTHRKNVGYVHLISHKLEGKKQIERQVDYIEKYIAQCEKDGYKKGDICILNNNNAPLNSWGIELLKRNILVVSNDSLFITNEPKVLLFISYLKRRVNPKNITETKHFAYLFIKIKYKGDTSKYWDYFTEKKKNNKTLNIFNDKKFIADFFNGRKELFFEYENIYGLLQKFYKIMSWNELENAYLHHLSDIVYNFQKEKSGDIHSFLDYFSKNASKMTVLIPEMENAVKMMSIHKSKGLQFPVVILPDMDFSIKLNSLNKHLIKVDKNIAHTSLKKETKIKEIKEAYIEENKQICIDKVNLLYVGLTRAKDRIYGINEFKGDLGSCIDRTIKKHAPYLQKGNNFIWGKEKQKEAIKTKSNENFFNPTYQSESLWFPDIALNKSERENSIKNGKRFGNAFHLLMSKVNKKSQIDLQLNKLIETGKIEYSFKKELKESANKLFKNKRYLNILLNANHIINEPNIIIDSTKTKRPDKIIFNKEKTYILEFKTGKQETSHLEQINEYISLLQQMNYPDVNGILYYTSSNLFIEIPT